MLLHALAYVVHIAYGLGGGADEQSRVEAASVYVLPPVRYEDLGGGWFVKIGGGPNDPMAEDPGSEAIDAWLATEGDAATADWLAASPSGANSRSARRVRARCSSVNSATRSSIVARVHSRRSVAT